MRSAAFLKTFLKMMNVTEMPCFAQDFDIESEAWQECVYCALYHEFKLFKSALWALRIAFGLDKPSLKRALFSVPNQ